MAFKILFIFRIVIGFFFMVSGFEKLVEPSQNFHYVVQSYEVFNLLFQKIVVFTLPWIELFLGVFLVLGLWLKWILRGLCVLIAMFIIIVSQALLRGLPITECGCFGDLISFPLPGMIIFDSLLLLFTGLMLFKQDAARVFSLDRYFDA